MKKIEAIVRPNKVSDVCAALEKVGHPGLMIGQIEGHGRQKGLEQQVRGKTYKVDLLTKTKIGVIVEDEDVDRITKAIIDAAKTGKVGDGKIFILPVEKTIRIRTGEIDDEAL